MRLGTGGRLDVGAPLLDAAVPRADVLADVAAVDLRAERRAVLAPGSARGACVQYERHCVASSDAGLVQRAVGQASMQSVHVPQSASSGGVGSTSAVVTSVPSTTHEPCRRVISSVFLP